MKILVQKVLNAAVTIDGQTVAQIKQGLLIFIGIEKDDTASQADFLAKKVANLPVLVY